MAAATTADLQRDSSASEPAVRAQLERMEHSPLFANSPRLCRLLRYLVEHSLAGDTRELREYVVGVEVFDRSGRYDPSTDTIVRSTARRLRSRLDAYYSGEGRVDPVRFDLPRGHYRIEFREVDEGRTRDAGRRESSGYRVGIAAVLACFALIGIWWSSDHLLDREPVGDTAIDPRAREHLTIGQHLFNRRGAGDLELALEEFQRATLIDPQVVDAWVGMAGCMKILAALAEGPQRDQGRALLLFALGREAEAVSAMQSLSSREGILPAELLAEVYAYRGDTGLALEQVQIAYRMILVESPDPMENAWLALPLRNSPFLRQLHADERWQAWSDQISRDALGELSEPIELLALAPDPG